MQGGGCLLAWDTSPTSPAAYWAFSPRPSVASSLTLLKRQPPVLSPPKPCLTCGVWGGTTSSHPWLLSWVKIVAVANFRGVCRKQTAMAGDKWLQFWGQISCSYFSSQLPQPQLSNHSSTRGQNSPGHLGMGENAWLLQALLAQFLL